MPSESTVLDVITRATSAPPSAHSVAETQKVLELRHAPPPSRRTYSRTSFPGSGCPGVVSLHKRLGPCDATESVVGARDSAVAVFDVSRPRQPTRARKAMNESV